MQPYTLDRRAIVVLLGILQLAPSPTTLQAGKPSQSCRKYCSWPPHPQLYRQESRRSPVGNPVAGPLTHNSTGTIFTTLHSSLSFPPSLSSLQTKAQELQFQINKGSIEGRREQTVDRRAEDHHGSRTPPPGIHYYSLFFFHAYLTKIFSTIETPYQGV